MFRVFAITMVCAFLTTAAGAVDLAYKQFAPGVKLLQETKETGEFLIIADLPGAEQLRGTIKGNGKAEITLTDLADDHGVVKVSGSHEATYEAEGLPIPPIGDDIGPATLHVTQEGNVTVVDLPRFQADGMSVMQFGWWGYITKQLNLVDGLPLGPVKENELWENTTTIKSPVGGELTVTTKSQVIGTSWDNGKCAWIHSKTSVPLKLKFKTEESTSTVLGSLDMFAVTCFNLDKGFPTGKQVYHLANLSLTSKASEDGYGEDYSIRVVAALRNEITTRLAQEEKKEAQKQAGGKPTRLEPLASSK